MYTYLYSYTYTCTLLNFSVEIVIVERYILRFPEFHKVPLFAAVSLFPDNRDTIFSHKVHLKLFQKQYNGLIKKSFLIFPIYKKSKELKRAGHSQKKSVVFVVVGIKKQMKQNPKNAESKLFIAFIWQFRALS